MLKKLKKLSKKFNKLSYWNTTNRFPALKFLNSPDDDTNKNNETNKFHVSLKYIAWLCDKLEGKIHFFLAYLCVVVDFGVQGAFFNIFLSCKENPISKVLFYYLQCRQYKKLK